tara:strand:- start:352 stop:798 length:447 start_codon:yes stop_codon:yes gene_type:complete
MRYNQIVSLKNINFKIVSKSFREIKFVNFLISFQPVKIISWEGVENNKKAYFKLWFFGWKNFKVKHSDFSLSDETLTFTDKGEVLPFGLTNWNHIHTVIRKDNNTIIYDSLSFNHPNKFIGFLLYPILISPIFLRKILYPLYFKRYIK